MKLSLYLETTVLGAYLDNGDPFRRDLTMRWFERELGEYRVCTSMLVRRELERIDEPHRSSYLRLLTGLELADELVIHNDLGDAAIRQTAHESGAADVGVVDLQSKPRRQENAERSEHAHQTALLIGGL